MCQAIQFQPSPAPYDVVGSSGPGSYEQANAACWGAVTVAPGSCTTMGPEATATRARVATRTSVRSWQLTAGTRIGFTGASDGSNNAQGEGGECENLTLVDGGRRGEMAAAGESTPGVRPHLPAQRI